MASRDHRVTTLEALEALYDKPYGPSVIKEIDHINPHYRKFIEAAPFFALATSGPEGLDCSPRGDAPGFVRVADEKMLLIPDRRGNNRIDSLRNILADPRVALLFLIPGVGETIRVIGRASILTDPAFTESFIVNGKAPRTVIVVAVERCFINVRRRSSARNCGTRLCMSTARACPAPEPFLPRSLAAKSAVPSTTAASRSGSRRRCTRGFSYRNI